MSSETLKDIGKITLLAGLFFVPFLGAVHLFDWDEINFAEISREMIELDDYLRIHVNFLPFWEKPPFFFWLQVLAMKAFGVGEFAARLPNAICGMLTLSILYLMGKQLYNRSFGLLWSLVYLGSLLPHLYFRSGIIDPWFNLFIFAGLYLFLLFYWKKEKLDGIALPYNGWTYLFLAGLTVGMGILTKGPVAYLVVALCFFVYWIGQRLRLYISVPQFLFFSFATTLVTLTWYGLETMRHGPWFISEFNTYQYRLFSTPDAGHKGFPGYHFAVLLIGCFPASIFAIRAMFSLPAAQYEYQKDFRRWMLILFWVVLILFSIVQSKIVHYSSICYFPLSFLASLCLYEIWNKRLLFGRWLKWGLLAIGSLFVGSLLVFPYLAARPALIAPFFQDPFALESLYSNAHWSYASCLPAIWLVGILIFSIAWFRTSKTRPAILLLFLGNALFITFTLWSSMRTFESYSQNAAIEFLKSKASEDCYIQPWGYKTYGHLLYAQKRVPEHEKSYDVEWLLNGAVDKPVYFISKIHLCENLEQRENLEEISRKNGFVFFKRKEEVDRKK
ncbi:MAG: glycosyltransferase family 39 protein [Bacteroidota bacterium]